MNKYWKLIKNIIFYAVVVFLASYLLLDAFAPDKTVNVFGFKAYVIISPSMQPTLNVNDAVVVKKVDIDNITEGDIITFKAYLPDLGSEAYVTHYVGEVIGEGEDKIFKTHGEGEEDFDIWVNSDGSSDEVTVDEIIGIYGFKIANAGKVFRIIQDPVMVGLLVVNVLLVVIIVKYYQNTKKIEEVKSDDEPKDL
jgi:signal peptidase I